VSYPCRSGCGACCIAPSISPAPPALPHGKPAGVRCPHLIEEQRCALFGKPERPPVCSSLRPEPAMCGETREEALRTIGRWERQTAPARDPRS
jgi:hypothetical protein